ncbi:hypothetical protein GLOIN_2v1502762 [Rhizophagus irregularis DAOM 181602=DAOM 197198]|uniref:Uncharacterized protein n=1 Tax=Rhizophagus irregularis (strain DAOM 181602 / DAOM 197198 / MUCL 43194) TaxID=747089 RepID=A0A2P4QW05_RHIID|nr:hypothetical protein GLOIN_2v1502762 [Rhizophagus irregularis DAOM 181602=DAOM 197198]POG81809.1 hypothetical protein GLOIN_2v1502762 [Rhizophagus irregularis DAOM 181602=DAOM 197198]|eukprot:XP_025188675.1 hypothetical protein GLOIN_2v1502762 [Rhizophagus irregularis DAOM 181602=DAOM 197198]
MDFKSDRFLLIWLGSTKLTSNLVNGSKWFFIRIENLHDILNICSVVDVTQFIADILGRKRLRIVETCYLSS